MEVEEGVESWRNEKRCDEKVERKERGEGRRKENGFGREKGGGGGGGGKEKEMEEEEEEEDEMEEQGARMASGCTRDSMTSSLRVIIRGRNSEWKINEAESK